MAVSLVLPRGVLARRIGTGRSHPKLTRSRICMSARSPVDADQEIRAVFPIEESAEGDSMKFYLVEEWAFS